MTTDEWTRGYDEAFELRFSPADRDLQLRVAAVTWSPARLTGFLAAHEVALRLVGCTCRDCPVHHAPSLRDAC